jgi:cephalosporin-C deacetylase-like acetyl esterase
MAIGLALTGCFARAGLAPGISITADRAGAVYTCGEEARIAISVRDDRGALLTTGRVAVTVDPFGTNRLLSATYELAKANPVVWRGTLRVPGFLRCGAKAAGGMTAKPVVYGVGFSPEAIRLASGGAPGDFDAYWRGESERLDREVPLDPRAKRLDALCTERCEAFAVSFATFGGKRVYGFLTVPKGREGPFPLLLTVPWAGPGVYEPDLRAGAAGSLSLVLNVHDYEPGPDAASNSKKYAAQNRLYADEVKGIKLRSAYENHRYAGYTDRTTYFYHDALLGIRRGVLWALARPDVDRTRVGYVGRSQGGGIGLMLVALTPGVTRALFCQPAFTDLLAYRQGRRSGWPCPVERARPADRAAVEQTAAYYDAGHFASRLVCETRVIIGFADDTCPPPGVYAAYNEIRAPKTILHDVGVPHSDPPSFQPSQAWVLEAPGGATKKAEK